MSVETTSPPKYRWNMFWPHIPNQDRLFEELRDTLSGRWIGQGPKVDKFEKAFSANLDAAYTVAVNSGTAALHLAYILAGIKKGDCVISPVFTCTATNHALLYQGADILFNDVAVDTMCSDVDHARELCEKSSKIKAIVAVHIAGDPCSIDNFLDLAEEYRVPLIFDAAQALGATYNHRSIDHPDNCGFASCHSFQAIKHITTGDGGMLVLPDWTRVSMPDSPHFGKIETTGLYERAKRLRWFAIDRDRHRKIGWQPWLNRGITNDQNEVGYKYQMTDLDACFGLVGLRELDVVIQCRKNLVSHYLKNLQMMDAVMGGAIKPMHVSEGSSCSMFGVFVDDRENFCKAMADRGVETNVVQVRNDAYQVFKEFRHHALPNMDALQDRYVYLPLNTRQQ